MKNFCGYYESDIGLIEVIGSDDEILSVKFIDSKKNNNVINPIVEKAILQLDEYFKGKRSVFDLKLRLNGTEFQNKVWNELMNIPYGEICTYKDLSIKIGNDKASRAVGGANNKNPIAIIIPCHRVIGSNKKLVGYAGGLDKKQWILEHEKKNVGLMISCR